MARYKVRPSSLWIINQCPAAALIPALPHDHVSADAQSGIELHAVAKRSGVTRLPLPSWLSDEQLSLIESYLVIDTLPIAFHSLELFEVSLPTISMYDHLSIDERNLFNIQDCTPDLIYFRNGKLVIRDLKTGTMYIEVKDNLQLLCYGICAAEYLDCEDMPVVLEICQMIDGEPTITIAEYSVEELKVHRLRIKLMINNLAATAELEHSPGDYCSWCWRLHECKCHADDEILLSVPDCTEQFLTENAHRIANIDIQIKALEALKKAVKQVLNRHHGEYGGFRLIGYDRKNTTCKNVELMLQCLEKLGYDRTKLAELKPIAFGKLCNIVKKEHMEIIAQYIEQWNSRVEKIVVASGNIGPDENDFEGGL